MTEPTLRHGRLTLVLLAWLILLLTSCTLLWDWTTGQGERPNTPLRTRPPKEAR